MQYEATSVILLAEARHHELQIEAARHGLKRQAYGPALDVADLLAAARRRLGLAQARRVATRSLAAAPRIPPRAAQPG